MNFFLLPRAESRRLEETREPAQRPLNSGFRFSVNAVRPSFASSLREGEVERTPLGLEAGGERRLEGAVDRLLGKSRGHRALLGDLARDAFRLVEPCLLGHDPSDEAGGERLPGREPPAAQDHVHRQCLPDGAGQPLRAAGAGNDPEPGLGLAELRRLGGDDQVARHRQLAAAAEAVAGDGRDERRPERADRVPALDPPLVVELDRGDLRQLADVGAGGEGTLGAAEHDAAHRPVAVELLERRTSSSISSSESAFSASGRLSRTTAIAPSRSTLDEAHLRSRKRSIAFRGSSVAIESASQSRAWLIVSCHAKSFQKFRCCFA